MLKAGGFVSLAAMLSGIPMLTAPGPAQATPPPSAGTPGSQPRPGAAAVSLTQPTPYSIGASCELSEDYFLTDQVMLTDAGDLVLPFSGQDGTVEAVVLAGGLLHHLRPDPTQTSGWTYTTIPTYEGWTIINAAVVTDGSGLTSLLLERAWALVPTETTTMLYTLNSSTGVWNEARGGGTNEWPIAKIQGGLSPNGEIYFAVFGTGGQMGIYTNETIDGFTIFTFFPLEGVTLSNPVETLVLWDGTPGGGPYRGWLLTVGSSGVLDCYAQTGIQEFEAAPTPITPGGSGTVSTLVSATRPSVANQAVPDVVFQDSAGGLYLANGSTVTSVQVDLGDTPGVGHAAAWDDDGTYSFAYLNVDGLISIITGYEENGVETFTAPIPLQPGFQRIYAQPADPSQGTIFAVGADDSLNILTRNPISGSWQLLPVHQDGETLTEVASWRVQISVLDANGSGVAGGQVQLTSDQLIGVWQPAGNTFLDDQPLTMTTDGWGLLTFSLPAIELDTATLTATALGPDGQPSGTAQRITPDIDAHKFLAGQGSLTDIGQLDGPALQNATNSDGTTKLLPVLAALPADQQGTSATAIAQAMNHASALGFGFIPQSSTDPQSAMFDLSSGAPTFQTSTNPNAYDDLTAVEGISDWWDKAKHDAKSAFHAVRHAAVGLKKMVTTWAEEAKAWTINLIVDIGDGLDNLMNWVITGVEDAIHAISGFFQALGADLKQAWDWLKHNVLDLLKETGANAKIMEGWLDQASQEFGALIATQTTWLTGYFTGLETKASTAISTLASDVEQLTFGQAAPLTPPNNDSSSSDTDALLKGLADFGKVMHYASGAWLWDKIKSYLPHKDTGSGPPADAKTQALIPDAITVITGQISAIVSLGQLVATTYEDLTSPAAFSEKTMADFFNRLNKVVHEMLALADALANMALGLVSAAFEALDNVLNYEVAALPFIGQLLSLAGIDPTLTVKHLVALLAAFPATLVNGIINKGNPLFPSDQDEAVEGAPADPWGVGLNTGAFGVQMVWAFVDFYEDLKGGDDAQSVPDWCSYVDNIAPILLAILTWPGNPVNNKTPPPFSDRNTGGPDGAMIDWFQILGVAPSALALCGWLGKITSTEPDSNEPYDNYFLPGANCAIGIGSIVLTSLWNWATSQNTNSKSIGIMGELSYVMAPLAIQEVAEATEGVSFLVKLAIDTVGNMGTGVAFVDAASSA
ncbi:MAG: hypothetical protein ABWY56_16530 [Propionibacteriaceae bacterium]